MALVIQSSVIPHKLYGYCLLISLWKNVIGGWQNDTRGQSVYHPGQWRKSETSSLGCMERTKSWKFFWSPHMQLINTYIYMNMHTPTLLIKKILRFFLSETALNLFYISQWLTYVRQRLYHCAISTIFCIYFVFLTHCIYLYLLCILRYCLTSLSGLDLNSLCCPGRPWSCNPPTF